MTALSVAPGQSEPLAEWLEPSLQDTAGQDPLGLNTITLDRILPRLLPGVLQLSQRARYFSIYPWLLWQFSERRRAPTREALDDFIRRREYELCLAMKLCPHCDVASAIGALSAGPRVNAAEDPFERGYSIETKMGGFGLYYRSPLVELGAIAAAGTPMGPDELPTPIEVLRHTPLALELAEAFHEAIAETEYFRSYERNEAPIPRVVLEELAASVCLCGLGQPERRRERDAIRHLLFEPASETAAAACDARRRAFAHFLSLLDDNGHITTDVGEFWRGAIARFEAEPNGDAPRVATAASWGALAMKECAQEAVCSIWADFCRGGLRRQGHEGLSSAGLREMTDELADGDGLAFGDAQLSFSAATSAASIRLAALEAAAEMDWEDVRAWVVEADSAASGLVALLVFAARLPRPEDVDPAWSAVACQHSERQYGLLDIVRLLERYLESDPSFGDLVTWAVQHLLIGPHEAIAYSKLPKATFRFLWEESGRMRFFTPGESGGLRRFEPSDDRRGAMASLSQDLGYWASAEDSEPTLSDDGRAFVAEVLA
jgi:hypothetical protein